MTTARGAAATRRPPRRASFPVARVAGIEIRVHATFLLLLALVGLVARGAGFTSAVDAVAWVVVLFACVVVHELAHSLVARRRGADVHEILLFPLGGISRLEHLPERPRDELTIAIVGPAASAALGIAAGALALALGRSLLPIDIVRGAWLPRLLWVNLLLAAFNLLPAFPLDGGRVLRALLERTRSLEDATRIATRVGHVLAGALVAVGVLFDLWLALIGLFVWFGASAEEVATIVHARLRGHHVREVMRTDLDRIHPRPGVDGAVGPDDPLSDDVVAALAGAQDRQLAVLRGGSLVGVLRLEDVERLVRAG